MQRPPDLHERVSRIEEKMAARDDVAELRGLIERRNSTARWLRANVSAIAIGAGFSALILIFTRWERIAGGHPALALRAVAAATTIRRGARTEWRILSKF